MEIVSARPVANDSLLSFNLSSEIAALVRLLGDSGNGSSGVTQLRPVQVAALAVQPLEGNASLWPSLPVPQATSTRPNATRPGPRRRRDVSARLLTGAQRAATLDRLLGRNVSRRRRGRPWSATLSAILPPGAMVLTSLDYNGAHAKPQEGGASVCGQKNLDTLMDRVESQVTMCCHKQQCEDTPAWHAYGYSCADLEQQGVCQLGAFTVKYDWLYEWSWQFNHPEKHCCACGRREGIDIDDDAGYYGSIVDSSHANGGGVGAGFECGRKEQSYCLELTRLGLGGCELNCRHMWELACVRWTELHGERCPMCSALQLRWEQWPDGRHRDKIDNPTPPGTPLRFECFVRKLEGRLRSYSRWTRWNDWGGGNSIYLDRHWPFCSDRGDTKYVMNGFWIFGWGSLAVHYRCTEVCEPNSVPTWHATPLFPDGQWIFRFGYSNAFFLLLHHVYCPRGSVLKGWHLDRGGTSDRMRFVYACQPVSMVRDAEGKHRRSTRWQSIVRGRMWGLMWHSPACDDTDGYTLGQGLRGFNLRLRYHRHHRRHGGWRQQFRYYCQDLEPQRSKTSAASRQELLGRLSSR